MGMSTWRPEGNKKSALLRVGAEHSRTRGQQRLKNGKKFRVAEAKLGENRRDLAMEVTAGWVTHIRSGGRDQDK